MNKKLFIAVVCVALFAVSPVKAQEFKGAGYLVEQLGQAVRQSEDVRDNFSLWERDLEEFQKGKAQLTLEKQAESWLALYDRMWKLTLSEEDEGALHVLWMRLFKDWLMAIPEPETWELIYQSASDRAESRKPADAVLRYLSGFLVQDAPGMAGAIKQMEDLSRSLPEGSKGYVPSLVWHLSSDFVAAMGTPQERAAFWAAPLPEEMSSHNQISYVPDLVTMAGVDKAKEYLSQAMASPRALSTLTSGEKTQALARDTALEQIDRMAAPQWALAHSLDADDLYEALVQKFPATLPPKVRSFGDPAREPLKAMIYHVLSLVTQGRADAAKAEAITAGAVDYPFDYGIFKSLTKSEDQQAVAKFLRGILQEDPKLYWWPYYLALAPTVGEKPEDVILLLKEALLKPDLPNETQLKSYLVDAYISEKRWGDARTVIEDIGKAPAAAPAPDNADNGFDDSEKITVIGLYKQLLEAILAADQLTEVGPVLDAIDAEIEKDLSDGQKDRAEQLSQVAADLTAAGRLLDDPQWVQKGLNYFERAEAMAPQDKPWGVVSRHVNALTALGKYPQAEGLLIDEILRKVPKKDEPAASSDISGYSTALLELYFKAGRYADMIVLMDSFPYWRHTDLGKIGAEFSVNGENFKSMLAKAFAEEGRVDLGLALAKEVILKAGGHDPSYELLMQHEPRWDLITWFDQLVERDPFEERPLIWKAVLLLKFQKYDEAEASVKQAIAIDPSDGEQGPGNRMRAYAVMAAIKRAQGKPEEAEQFEKIVRAIRLSEEADKFLNAHLTGRALTKYAQALDMFDGAYCIQSRLAVRLNHAGRYTEAEKHYKKAFSLMPASFGRLESHCFGCEKIFDGERQQAMAEKVFTSMLAEDPKKPQLYYLMGYLRSQQGRTKEAFDHFQKAVNFDPQYLNAWVKLGDMARSIGLPQEEVDKIAVHVLKIDPYFRHHKVDPKYMWDMKTVWNILKDRRDPLEVEPVSYPLKAAQKRAENLPPVEPHNPWMDEDEATWPAGVLADNGHLQSLYGLSTQLKIPVDPGTAGAVDGAEAIIDPAKAAGPADADEAPEFKTEEHDAGETAETGDAAVAQKESAEAVNAVITEVAK